MIRRQPYYFKWQLAFLITLIGPLFLYYAFNKDENCDPRNWFAVEIKEYTFAGLTQKLPILSEKKIKAIDCKVSDTIARLGYAARFHFGEYLPFVYASTEKNKPIKLYVKQESLYQFPSVLPKIKSSLGQIKEFLIDIKSLGIIPVVVFVPTKVSIEREQILALPSTDNWLSLNINEKEDAKKVYEEIASIDSSAINLYDLFRRNSEESVFVPWDYHWSNYGVALAAMAIMEKIGSFDSFSASIHLSKGDKLPFNAGDAMILWHQLPMWYIRMSKRFEWYEYVYKINIKQGKLKQANVYLAGTSFSDRYRDTEMSLPYLLSQIFSGNFYNCVVSGGGVDKGIKKVWSQNPPPQRGDIVIWEIPITTLLQDNIEFPDIVARK